ncbi:Lrp/AsnC family transcriptional regulator [Streptomyces sp. NPDC127098]|uniref:Lrp/AsnC family transcriptional regulator n=1 Tax=Streptomyces sp. NPDC127098 TaxID=3347137 RepID=UPI0036657F22
MDLRALDELDRWLVHALQLDGRAAFTRIGEVLGVSHRTVARRYRALCAAGVLRVRGLRHARRTGQAEWSLRLRCRPAAAVEVAHALARRPDTSWVALTATAGEVLCAARTAAAVEHHALLTRTLPRTPEVREAAARLVLRTHVGDAAGRQGRLAALGAEQVAALRGPAPEGSTDPEPYRADAADQALFVALAADGRATARELAARAGRSESWARERVERLRRKGVLYFEADVDAARVGHHDTTVLWLTTPPAHAEAVARALTTHSPVVFAAATTGSSNLMAAVVTRDTDALHSYLTGPLSELAAVTHVESAPVLRVVKRR